MIYRFGLLYYYSGTGNTYRLGVYLREYLVKEGISTCLLPIYTDVLPGRKEGLLLGILLPTYSFTAPWPLLRFLFRLPKGEKREAFVLVTRGGLGIGPVQLPGLEGSTGYLVALLLMMKGYVVKGVLSLDMPSNWTVIHPGLKREVVENLTTKAKDRARDYMGRLLAGKRSFSGFLPLFFGFFLFPVSLAFLFYSRFLLAKLFFAKGSCTGCGLCAKYCQERALKMVKNRPYWSFACQSCMRCMAYCKEGAIEASHSFAFLLVLLIVFSFRSFLSFPGHPFLKGGAYLLGILLLISLLYSLLHSLLGFPIVNQIFARSTLTTFFRKYHEPNTDLEDLLGGEEPLFRE